MGGVSSWCDLLVSGLDEFDWQVLPIVAPGKREPLFTLPPQAREVGRIEVWSEELPRGGGLRRANRPAAARHARPPPDRLGRRPGRGAGRVASLPAAPRGRAPRVPLAPRLERVPGRRSPRCSTSASRRPGRRRGWTSSRPPRSTRRCTGSPARRRCRRRETDVLHVTAAGWSAIPAVVHKALHGTPMVLTEHGVYLREAYLASVRSGDSPGARFAATRLARGLARSAYAGADVDLPGDRRQRLLGAGPRHRPGEDPRPLQRPAPAGRADAAARAPSTVVSVGRIDPLKDIHTLLRVAAETLRLRARTRGSCTTARSAPARRPTGARARRCTRGSGSATASASWAARPIPTAPSATPTWC